MAVASALLGLSEPELLRETFAMRDDYEDVQRLQPGMAVACGERLGVLEEFHLGRWRLLGDSFELLCAEEELKILDKGLRPERCCQKCWALAKQLTSQGGLYEALCLMIHTL